MEVMLGEYRDMIVLHFMVAFSSRPPFCCWLFVVPVRRALDWPAVSPLFRCQSGRRGCVADPSAPAASGPAPQRNEENEFDSAANLCHTFEGQSDTTSVTVHRTTVPSADQRAAARSRCGIHCRLRVCRAAVWHQHGTIERRTRPVICTAQLRRFDTRVTRNYRRVD